MACVINQIMRQADCANSQCCQSLEMNPVLALQVTSPTEAASEQPVGAQPGSSADEDSSAHHSTSSDEGAYIPSAAKAPQTKCPGLILGYTSCQLSTIQ